MNATDFRFAYDPGVIRHGRDCVADLGAELDRLDSDRALVVCGQTVGATPAVVDPVREGLGDALAGVFDETTPEKRLSTALDAVDRLRACDADAIVAVGGGSSLDVAKVASLAAGSPADRETLGQSFEETGTVTAPDGEVPPVLAVPTTLAGADMSMLAGITATPASGLVSAPVSGGVWDERLLPAALYYDPNLVETTPRDILAASAMNGFDKGVETLYAANATPVTDATAIRGLELLRDGLPTLTRAPEQWATGQILRGMVLVQYGISRVDGTTLSVIHAFGHALSDAADIQQGTAHALIAPHALDGLFAAVDGRRDLLARALGVETACKSDDTLAAAVVAAVRAVRDGLDLPRRLRAADGLVRDELDDVARATKEDSLMGNCPPGYDPSVDELRAVLDAAW